ncbi:MAG: class B sortase [Erysipelotrichaceae bacterium]
MKYKRIYIVSIIILFIILIIGLVCFENNDKLIDLPSDDLTVVNKVDNQDLMIYASIDKLAIAKEDNTETIAWLRVPDTDVDNQVMQTTDNSKYLYTNEQGDYDRWGCYFADYYSNLTSKEQLNQNTVIYGHSGSAELNENPDGNRFSQLFRFLELDFINENPYIYLTINDDVLPFEIFAVFHTSTDFYYINPTPSNVGFEEFINTITKKNEYIFEGVDVEETDKILTLSTCSHRYDIDASGNHRLVVMGKLVDGVKEKESNIFLNSNPERP